MICLLTVSISFHTSKKKLFKNVFFFSFFASFKVLPCGSLSGQMTKTAADTATGQFCARTGPTPRFLISIGPNTATWTRRSKASSNVWVSACWMSNKNGAPFPYPTSECGRESYYYKNSCDNRLQTRQPVFTCIFLCECMRCKQLITNIQNYWSFKLPTQYNTNRAV